MARVSSARVEEVGDNRVRLTVEVTAAQWKHAVEHAPGRTLEQRFPPVTSGRSLTLERQRIVRRNRAARRRGRRRDPGRAASGTRDAPRHDRPGGLSAGVTSSV